MIHHFFWLVAIGCSHQCKSYDVPGIPAFETAIVCEEAVVRMNETYRGVVKLSTVPGLADNITFSCEQR